MLFQHYFNAKMKLKFNYTNIILNAKLKLKINYNFIHKLSAQIKLGLLQNGKLEFWTYKQLQ